MRIVKIAALLALVLVFAVGVSWGKAPKSAIINSDHDLRSTYNAASFTACSFCHIAHKTGDAPTGPGPLLWNHTMSSVATYGVYQSDSFNGLQTDIADLGGQNTVSNLCLSCHDGTVAVNSFYEPVLGANYQPIATGTTFMPQDHRVKDLTKQHPINFTYSAALASKAGMLSPNSTTSVDAAGEIPLFSGKMQCATCHDPHNGNSSIFVQNFPTQTSGAFCTYCHL